MEPMQRLFFLMQTARDQTQLSEEQSDAGKTKAVKEMTFQINLRQGSSQHMQAVAEFSFQMRDLRITM
jgi:hypothetical protein